MTRRNYAHLPMGPLQVLGGPSAPARMRCWTGVAQPEQAMNSPATLSVISTLWTISWRSTPPSHCCYWQSGPRAASKWRVAWPMH